MACRIDDDSSAPLTPAQRQEIAINVPELRLFLLDASHQVRLLYFAVVYAHAGACVIFLT
jgi:hypothetical protein